MKKKHVKRILIITLLLVVFIAGGSLFMLKYSIGSTHRGQNLAQSYEYLFENYPFTKPWIDSLNTVSALKDTFITNHEGKKLHGYYIPGPAPTPKTAVIVHGYTDNAVRMMMIGYLFNHDLGYNILLPNLQFHGLSEGNAIQMGWKDRHDVIQWTKLAPSIFGDSIQIAIHGISMGAATAMMISGEEHPDYIKCFIEDCGYTSVWDEFAEQMKEQFHLPEFPLLYTSNWLCNLMYGWNFNEASSLAQISKCHLPMMFIHGDADTYVPTRMVYPLYEAKSEPKELWIVPGAKHAVSYKENKEEYTTRVKAFVDKYID